MDIGLISDIHGNLPALQSVLADMPEVDKVICAGDIVGYNPWPAECLDLVQETCSLIVQGNHDRTVDTPGEYAHNEQAKAGLEHAKRELKEEQREWLLGLPKRTEFVDGRYRLVHSHPDPDRLGTYVFPRDFPRMRPYLDDHDGIVLGHTHIQHKAVIDDRVIVNPGSVGQPRDGDSTAAYAVLNTDTDEVDLRRVEYDINTVISRVEVAGLPREIGTRLLDGN